MTSKERMLVALNNEKPDRLPVSIHQWQGYHLDTYLDGVSDIEACKNLGFDAQIQYFEDMAQFWLVNADYAKLNTPQWRDDAKVISADPDARVTHHTIKTPEGELTYKTAGDRKTTWITEYLIKHDDDIEIIGKYMPVPKLHLEPVSKAYDKVGDHGILRGFVWGDQAGCWQHAACLMDIGDLILATYDKPDWVHALLRMLLEKKLQFVESMHGAKFDLIETGGGSSSSTIISPRLHEEFCLPYDRELHDVLHGEGFKVSYHTCGGTLGIEEHIVANHCDASETLAPISVGGNQEPWDFKRKVGNQIALIGGIDQFNTLEGSDAEIGMMVRRLFETVGYDGGYICSCSDHFFDTPVEKLRTFTSAAHACLY